MADLKQMMKRQQVLADFGEFAIRSQDLDAVLMEACRLVGEATGTGRAKVLEIQEEGRELFLRAGVGWGPDVVGRVRLPMDERSSETYAIQAGEPVVCQDIAHEDRFEVPAFMKTAGVVALVNVPIFVPGQRPYGILQVDDTGPREFGEDEIQFLRTYATILGPVIDRLHLVEERRAVREKMFADLDSANESFSVSFKDIDQRKEAEMELLRIISILRTTFDSSLQIVQLFKAVRDEQDTIVDFEWVLTNKQWNDRWGPKTGKRLLTENPAVVESGVWDKFIRVMETGQPIQHELYYKHEQFDGWFAHSIAKADDGILLSALDVTEQKRTEKALSESEANYRVLFDSIDEGFCIVEMIFDEDGRPADYRFIECNASFERQTGLKDAAGQTMRALRPAHEQHWFDIYGEIALTGEPKRFEARADALGRWYDVYAFRVDEPERQRVAMLFNDVRDRKQAEDALWRSEERLRSAAEVGRLGLWDWDIPADEVHWSDEHFRMEGYEVGEVTPSYEAWAARVHHEDRPEAEAALLRARDRREDYDHEFRSVHPDGAVHWLHALGRFFYDEAGHPVRMVGAMTETTARREWEDRQAVLVSELQHRTRNLIAIVRSLADKTIKTSTTLTEFQAHFRERLEALARVQGLLSRLDVHDRVTFDDLIKTQLDALSANAERIALSGPAGIRLRSSTVQTLAMALHELATNAVKYGALRSNEGRLTVTWTHEAHGRDGKPWLFIDWRETGVEGLASSTEASRFGQGRELIERALPYQLDAETSFRLDPSGVHCTIALAVSDA